MGTLKTKAQNILTEKNTKIIPGNIKSGVEIFDVTGTYEGEAKVNLYCQNTEPTGKNGLWLKTNSITPSSIIEDDHVFGSEEWNTDKMSDLRAIPTNMYVERGQWSTLVGNYIYLYPRSSDNVIPYKYNILTDTYSRVGSTSMPYGMFPITYGTDIYLFGGYANESYSYYTNRTYKYDTTTGEYTKKANIPYNFGAQGGSGCLVGNEVFLFGSNVSSSERQKAYKYNISTNTWTQLTNLPTNSLCSGTCSSVGTDCYIFYGTDAYKYDTLIGTYTKLTSAISYSLGTYCSSLAIGTDIYLFGGYESKTTAYKYDTLTDTYTQLDNIPFALYEGTVNYIPATNEIYLFGGNDYPTKVQVMSLVPNTYADNSIVIANNNTNKYETKLIDTSVVNGLKYHFDNFWYATTENNVTTFDTTTEKYVGNGTTWNKIN